MGAEQSTTEVLAHVLLLVHPVVSEGRCSSVHDKKTDIKVLCHQKASSDLSMTILIACGDVSKP